MVGMPRAPRTRLLKNFNNIWLQIGQEHSLAIKRMAIDLGFGSMKPGWARVNFNYFIDDLEAAFIMRAVLQVYIIFCSALSFSILTANKNQIHGAYMVTMQIATHGWKLLPQYRLNALTGQYQYCDFDRRINVRSMDDINIGTPDTSVQYVWRSKKVGNEKQKRTWWQETSFFFSLLSLFHPHVIKIVKAA